MRRSLTAFSLAAIATVVAQSFAMGSAQAEPIRFDRSYVGAGVSAGVTNGGQVNDSAQFGGNIQGRLAVPGAPVSLRGGVLFSDDNAAISTAVTYDQRLSDKANAYAGVGYTFVDKNGKATQLGNRNSVTAVVGAEAAVSKDIVVYGDVKWGMNAYKNSPADALSVQAGVGYSF
jgi:hypothetical protein